MPEETVVITKRLKHSKKKPRKLVVSIEPTELINDSSNVKDRINKIVEAEIQKNGYRRQDDPLVKDLKKIVNNFNIRAKV